MRNPSASHLSLRSYHPLHLLLQYHTLLTSSTYSNIQCLPPLHEQVLAEADKEHLHTVLAYIYGNSMYRVSEFVISCRQVKVAGEVYGSLLARSNRNAYIMARWSTGTAINTSITSPRPGVVLFYCIVNVLVKSSRPDATIRTETCQHILCKVNWFFQHEHHRYYGYPVEVWSEHFYPLHSGSYTCQCFELHPTVQLELYRQDLVEAVKKLCR